MATEAERRWLEAVQLALINSGAFVTPYGMGCLSTPMTDTDLDRLIEGFRAALRTLGGFSR